MLKLRYRVIEIVQWDRTSLPIEGKEDWIEVGARPAMAMQQLTSLLVNYLLLHHSAGEADFEMRLCHLSPSAADCREERLRILYHGHPIFKHKYRGVYRLNGKPILSIEVPFDHCGRC
jgi:hypothetical protein